MQILLFAATLLEIEPTINWLKEHKADNLNVVITGVGLTAATYKISKSILTKKPNLVIQAGVAGSLIDDLELGKCVVINNECIGDLGVEENAEYRTIFDLGFEKKDELPWQDAKLPNKNLDNLNITSLVAVDAVTVNEISTRKDKIEFYKNKFNASVESMEGAALHYVAIKENVSFLQIRCISNYIGERDKTKWMLKEAVINLNNELRKIISKISEI